MSLMNRLENNINDNNGKFLICKYYLIKFRNEANISW